MTKLELDDVWAANQGPVAALNRSDGSQRLSTIPD